MSEKKIKICFVIDAMEVGGTENQLAKLINNLDKKRFKTYLVCLKHSDNFEGLPLDSEKITLNFNSFKSPWFIFKLIEFRSFLRRERIDIVQSFFLDANIFAILSARFAGVKRIISCRRDMGFWYNRKNLFILRALSGCVDRFLVNSIAIKKNISRAEKIPLDKIDVIYNGIQLDGYAGDGADARERLRKEFNIPSDHIVVGCIANLNREVKRVDRFIRTASLVSESAKKVSFLIIGDGYLKEELSRLADELNIGDRTVFTGLRNDIPALLKTMDIGVLTSDSEGISNSILEYMAAGLPAVVTDVGGNPELIEDNREGFLVSPERIEAIAYSVLKLVNDQKLRQTLGHNGKQKAYSIFSLENMVRATENYYINLVCSNQL